MIKFKCAGCGEYLEVPSSMRGEQESCPTCKVRNTVPDAQVTPAEDALSTLAAVSRHAGLQSPSLATGRRTPTAIAVATANRRPGFLAIQLCRCGSGLLLIIAFFLPWLVVSCNQNVLMQPSAVNLLTGIPDAKTNGTLEMIADMQRPLGGVQPGSGVRNGSRVASPTPARPMPEFSYWNIAGKRASNEASPTVSANDESPVQRLLAIVGFYTFAAFLMPVIVVLCGLMLWRRLIRGDLKFRLLEAALACTALTAILALVVFAWAMHPSSVPPALDVSMGLGFYLTNLALATFPILWVVERLTRRS
jgi:hypothetical protein